MSNGPNEVPYYHHRFPVSYFKGKGWRGWLVRKLNWLRWKFARWAEYHAMILLAKRNGLGDRSTIQALKLKWDEENEQQTRKRSALSSFGSPIAKVGKPQHRYEEGRKNSSWPEDEKDELARSLARGNERGGRYASGRDIYSVQEVDAELIKGDS